MKKGIALLLALAMIGTGIVGCSSGSSASSSAASSSAAPASSSAASSSAAPASSSKASSSSAAATGATTQLSYWTSNELHTKMYQFGEDSYNKKNPSQPVKLNGEVYPNAEMHNKLLIAIQSGVGAPDIADININYFANFVKGDNQLVDLTDIVTPVLPNAVKSRFDLYAKNGKYYGLPTHVGATVVYYNKEITDKAGIDINSLDTWDKYCEAGKQVVAKTGKPMTCFEVSNQRPFWPMIVQRGGDYLNKDGTVAMDSDINIKTLEYMQKMFFDDKIAVACPGGSTSVEEFWTFVNKGGCASLIMPAWYMSRFINYMPDLKGKIYVRPMPVFEQGDARTVGIGGTATSIISQCKNIDIAKKVITEAKLTKEACINIWTALMFDPVRTDVWDSPELKAPSAYFGNESFFDIIAPYKDNIPSPVNADLSAAAQDVINSTVMNKVFVEKSATPAEALKSAADELRKSK